MQEIISCPSCGRKLQVPDTLLGQDVQCPTCGGTFVAGGGNPPPPPAPSAPPGQRHFPAVAPLGPSAHDPYRQPRHGSMPHRASAVLTLGVLSLVAVPFSLGLIAVILGPIAWVMGNTDLEEIRRGRMDPTGEGGTNAGRICGMIGTLVGAAILVGFCLLIFLGAMVGNSRRF